MVRLLRSKRTKNALKNELLIMFNTEQSQLVRSTKMKKIVSGILCILLCISLVPEVLAVDIEATDANKSLNWNWASRDSSFENDIALKMQQIRLLQGVGKREDGTIDFGLDRQVTRMQAVLMLIRLSPLYPAPTPGAPADPRPSPASAACRDRYMIVKGNVKAGYF